jgi:hypothetical protein
MLQMIPTTVGFLDFYRETKTDSCTKTKESYMCMTPTSYFTPFFGKDIYQS